MTGHTWQYVWLAMAVVWGLGGMALALGLPPGKTGHLLGWTFGGMVLLVGGRLAYCLTCLPSSYERVQPRLFKHTQN